MSRAHAARGSWVPRWALNVAAAVGLTCLLVSLLAPVLGFRALIFESGSMSPTIPVGSLGVARLTAPDELRVGDIVTVPFAEKFVTHRIVKTGHVGRQLVVTLKGDGNRQADPTPYRVSSAVPRTLGYVPAGGSVLAWFTRTPGVYVLAAYLVLLMWRLQRHQQRRQVARHAADEPGPVETTWGRWLERVAPLPALPA